MAKNKYQKIFLVVRELWSCGYGRRLCFKDRGFESQHRILDGNIFTLFWRKNCKEGPKINEKEAKDDQLIKYFWIFGCCWGESLENMNKDPLCDLVKSNFYQVCLSIFSFSSFRCQQCDQIWWNFATLAKCKKYFTILKSFILHLAKFWTYFDTKISAIG